MRMRLSFRSFFSDLRRVQLGLLVGLVGATLILPPGLMPDVVTTHTTVFAETCVAGDVSCTDDDQDGIPNISDPCPFDPDPFCGGGGFIDPDRDGDGITDNADKCPDDPSNMCDNNIEQGWNFWDRCSFNGGLYTESWGSQMLEECGNAYIMCKTYFHLWNFKIEYCWVQGSSVYMREGG